MTKRTRLLPLALFIAIVCSIPAFGQVVSPPSQSQVESLSTLPEFDAVVYLNASRILNDAAPRLLPEKELKDFNAGLDGLKGMTTIDLRRVEQVLLVMRFNKMTPDKLLPIPDFMIVVRGDFDAKVLVGVATMMSDGKLREEKFGEHNLYLLTLNKDSKHANPFESAISEIAVATLDGNSIAVGTTSYIKTALDAADGRGRVKPETLTALVRDQNALMSAAGSPLMGLAKTFGLRIAENPDPNCMTKFGEFYLSLTMSDTDFKLNGVLNADNPDTAVIVKTLLMGLFKQGKELVPEKSAQSVFDQVKLSAVGSDVVVEATISQEMASKFVRDMLAPKPPKPPATETKTETKPVTKPVTKTNSGKSKRKT